MKGMVKLMLCPNCSATLETGLKFCPICGFNLEGVSKPPIQNQTNEPTDSKQQYNTQQPIQPVVNPQYQQNRYSQGSYQQNPSYTNIQSGYQPPSTGYSISSPLSVGDYIITFIISGIPMVGFIMLLVWACSSSTNINKKNYAIAILIFQLIAVVFSIIMMFVMGAFFASLFSELSSSSF